MRRPDRGRRSHWMALCCQRIRSTCTWDSAGVPNGKRSLAVAPPLQLPSGDCWRKDDQVHRSFHDSFYGGERPAAACVALHNRLSSIRSREARSTARDSQAHPIVSSLASVMPCARGACRRANLLSHSMNQPWLTTSDWPVSALVGRAANIGATRTTSSVVANSPSTVSLSMTLGFLGG